MRWTLAATLAAVLWGAGVTAPAARAGDDCGRVVVRHHPVRVERYVLREGYWREEVVPATLGLRFDFGSRRIVRVVVRPATVVRTWVPPVFGERVVRVRVHGHRACACD